MGLAELPLLVAPKDKTTVARRVSAGVPACGCWLEERAISKRLSLCPRSRHKTQTLRRSRPHFLVHARDRPLPTVVSRFEFG
jgi:hypothetical protein